MRTDIKLAAIRAAIVLTPSYGAAFLTERMVYVVPPLVATGFFAAAIGSGNDMSLRVDEDGDGGDNGDDSDLGQGNEG